MANPDWKWLETFVRAAEKGSLSAAAATLGTSQPTASRNLRCLEEQLGARLFVRHSRGLELTERGLELFAAARSLDEGVQAVFRKAAGLREEPAGTVRISVSEPMGVYVLPPCFAKLREDFPKLALELVIDNAVANLSRRDADIAVRMFRPEQLALVARRVGAVRLGLFATRGYLRRTGVPRSVDDMREHTLVGSDRDLGWARAITAVGLSPADFKFRTDSLVAQVAAILHGVGIGGMHARIAARHPTLVRVLPDLALEPVDAWLVMHEDLRNSPAVRTVFDALFTYLQRETEQSPGRKRQRERA
jgi:DNA-binding transcriptional LysR family regulator